MIILSGASEKIQVITGSAVSTIYVVASYVDKNGSSFVAGGAKTAITGAATTDVVAAPGASIQRSVSQLSIRNNHASSSNAITVQLNTGSAFELIKFTLYAGDTALLDSNGTWTIATIQRPVTTTVLTNSTGIYYPPASVKALVIECIGGGGGGGGCANAATNSAAGGGGGGGSYARAYVNSPDRFYTYTVGAGGAGGAAGNNGGSAGGTTSILAAGVTTTCSAVGTVVNSGGDSVATLHAGGPGGQGATASGNTGDVKFGGSFGDTGVALSAATAASGKGGNSAYGSGAPPVRNATAAGVDAQPNSGGGGSGGCIVSGGVSVPGGSGGSGVIIITEYR